MKRNILIVILSLSVFITLLVTGCVKDEGKLPAAPVGACDTITYTKHIKPIIENSCISCHGTPPNPGAPLLTNYNEVKANASKIKATVLDANPTPELMPQGGPPLPQAQKSLITCWLENGMKE